MCQILHSVEDLHRTRGEAVLSVRLGSLEQLLDALGDPTDVGVDLF